MYRLAVLNTHPIQYFAPLYRRLAREPDIDLTVYFCSRQGSEEYLDRGFGERIKWDVSLLDGYRYKFLNNLRANDQVGGFWSLINPQIVSELRRNGYDALWVNGHSPATYLMAILAAKALRIPVFMRCDTHLLLQRSTLKRVLRKPLMSFFYKRLCTLCLPVGTLNRQFYVYHGVPEDRLFTVPFAIDNEYFTSAQEQDGKQASLRQQLGLPIAKPLILFASKLLPRKRPMDLMRAFDRLRALGLDAGLVIVGSGEEEQGLKNYVKEHQLSDVYFFGFRNQSELRRFYSVSDVFVFPSENEPWGLVLNEVMCSGLPVIATRETGAVPDLLRHGENGFAYESGNVKELTQYLIQLLNNSEGRLHMGKASRKIIAEWDFERSVQAVRQALVSVRPHSNRVTETQAA